MKNSVKLISTLLGLALLFHIGIAYAEPVRRLLAAANQHTSTAAQPNFEHVHALAIDPTGKTLYLGAHTGLYRSEDGGRSWKRLGEDLSQLASVTVDTRKHNQIYVATAEGTIFKSADGGVKWVGGK